MWTVPFLSNFVEGWTGEHCNLKTETECQDGLDNDKGRNRQTIDKHKGMNRQTIDKHKGKYCYKVAKIRKCTKKKGS